MVNFPTTGTTYLNALGVTYLNSLGVLLIEGTDIKGISGIDLAPRWHQWRWVLLVIGLVPINPVKERVLFHLNSTVATATKSVGYLPLEQVLEEVPTLGRHSVRQLHVLFKYSSLIPLMSTTALSVVKEVRSREPRHNTQSKQGHRAKLNRVVPKNFAEAIYI